MIQSISPQQQKVIEFIECNTPHRFKGKTMTHAYYFIREHMEDSKKASKRFVREVEAEKRFLSELANFDTLTEPKQETLPPEKYEEQGGYDWGTGLGDVTGEAQNNGHHGMPDED